MRRFCIQALGLFLACWGFAHASAENELRRLIVSSPKLHEVFGGAVIQRLSWHRAETSVEIGDRRHALVSFRHEEKSPRIGSVFCHAALSRKERLSWIEELTQASDGDVAVAARLAETFTLTVTMSRVEDWTLHAGSGWHASVCAVASNEIAVKPPPMPGPNEVRAAVYQTAKALFVEGEQTEALERFRRLRSDRFLYPDAVLYLYAILATRHPEIAEGLRRTVVDLQRANDVDALGAYAVALDQAGYSAEARDARDRCVELGGSCI